MLPAASGLTIGERIAMARKVVGLNQHALAQRASYSLSMVRAVEQGREPASPAFVAAVARALSVETEELYGQPYRDLLDDDGGVPGLSELRTLFAEGNYLKPLEPGPADEIQAELERARKLRRSDKARQTIERMPVLLRQISGLVEASAPGEAQENAYRLLAQAFASTAQMVYRFGWMTLATQAVDRMEIAAEKAGDPKLLAHAAQQRSLLLLSYAAYDTGQSLVERSLSLLASEPDSESVLALRGSAHLRGAILRARDKDADRAREHIAEARSIGIKLGRTSLAYDTNFGPGNVEIHDVAVSLEIGDPGRAARDGSALIIPPDVHATRIGHHWQDVARAWMLSGEHSKAIAALRNARKASPQQTRYHQQVHETARMIALAEKRKSDSVANFVSWLGVKL
ncbi:helix-turn-helix domain-containing protein [Saccharopolyspora antimicrobica]|uniref:Helix-turn-helix protein n=1 Tax=Saccharopolyspora antimicrobica TaxID=455193 RepID=A0ABX9TB23_9PSEU|nr:helix-turn-helix transcriptional regulator [Saccharopolyspora antimicrobica]RKT84215.1 helix-turn-helix protein [Saccharopolyspora antimicrobica]